MRRLGTCLVLMGAAAVCGWLVGRRTAGRPPVRPLPRPPGPARLRIEEQRQRPWEGRN